MKTFTLCALALTLGLVSLASGQVPGSKSGEVHAQELLSAARAASGGEAKLKAVRGLEISAKFRRVVRDKEQDGELTLQFSLPDKFKRSVTRNTPLGEWMEIDALNGDQTWTTARSNSPSITVDSLDEEDPQALAGLRKTMLAEFYRYQLAWLLPPPSPSFSFNYVGEAEAADGHADVIDVNGPDKFYARLFLDKATHRLLLISYSSMLPPTNVIKAASGRPPAGNGTAQPGAGDPAQQPVEVQVFFSDYKPVGGIFFPFHIKQATAGRTDQEWEITKITVNPTFGPKVFEKK